MITSIASCLSILLDAPSVACDTTSMIESAEIVTVELLTFEEIRARYAPDWVLIAEPQVDENQQLQAGRVLFHRADGEEVCRKAMEYPPGRYALRFLGERPEEVVLL